MLDPTFQYIGIATCLHETQEVVTVILLAEDVTSLVAPGNDGRYIKRQPLKQEHLSTIVTMSMKKNEKSAIRVQTASSFTPTINKPETKYTQSVFYG